jgi:phage terminase large subunit
MEYLTNEVFAPLITDKKRFNFLIGGAGSGKSKFVADKHIDRIFRNKGERVLVARKVKETIYQSVFQELKKSITEHELQSVFKINESSYGITCLLTGSQIITCGLDDHEKIKSISGITAVWGEEATEFEKVDFDQLDLRMRQGSSIGNQGTFTCNPIDETHWIKTFVEDPNNIEDLTLNRSTFLDNAFLSVEYKNNLIKRYRSNPLWWDVYVLGKWGRVRRGGEFYYNFSNNKHVLKGLEYNSNLPLHISFDFNVHPFITITIWQTEGKKVWQVDELCVVHPDNNTPAACRIFLKKYFYEKAHSAGLFVYGDPAGRHEDTRSESGSNDFTLIMNTLAEMHPTLRITSAAPAVKMRGDFINACYGSNYADIHIYHSDKCIKSIESLSFIKQDREGGKVKEKVKDTVTGVTYEKYGHTDDSEDYFLCYYFAQEYNNFQHGGKGTPAPMYLKKPKIY